MIIHNLIVNQDSNNCKQSYINTPLEVQSNENCTNSSPPEVISTNSPISLHPAVSSPPEVTASRSLAESSSNYLPVNGNATPGDRGGSIVTGPQVEPESDLRELEGQVNRRADGRTTSSGEPAADLREAEGEVNRGSRLQDKERTSSGDGKTTSGGKTSSINLLIINTLSMDSLGSFMDMYTSWSCNSNWLQYCNSREGNNQIVIAQIIGMIYKNKYSMYISEILNDRCMKLIDMICNKLDYYSNDFNGNISLDVEIEFMIITFMRVILLVYDLFSEAYKIDDNISNVKMMNEFYCKISLDKLWLSLDLILSVLDLSASPTFKLYDNIESYTMESLRILIPLIEVYLLITRVNISIDYNLKCITQLDDTISMINFDIDIGDEDKLTSILSDVVDYNLDDDSSHLDICKSHLNLLYFVERHKKVINLLVKQTPSLLNSGLQSIIRLAPICLNFDIKRQYFRQKLKEKRQGERLESIKINVRREHVFLDSYHQLRLKTGEEMKGKLSVSFGGEEGVDAGGLTREWFTILSKEMFNPNYGLFRREGRVIGKAVYDGHHMDAYFCRSFYKHMLGRKITPADAESVDPQFFKNLTSINECKLEDLGLELYFSTEIDEFGKIKVIDLIPNGRNIPVTDDNKHKYIKLLCRHKVTNGIKEQLDAFMTGFRELISPELISIFDDRELELLISGIPTIDLNNMKQNVEYVNYTENSQQIIWLWEILAEFDQNHLAAFLQFVTGTSRVPIGGFKNLMGMRGPQRISIHKTFGDDRLPTAHTCFNQLDLPAYTHKHLLESKLLQAILEGKEGFGFV